jgi:signal transduction histidine kinase
LRTLLSNLVDNALRYTGSGGRVDVAVRTEDGRATLIVRDDGPGIPPAERARVFDRFYRGQPAGDTARAGLHGSGLGLAIVKNIADRHGATVELGPGIDDAGLGATVRFPAAAGA